MKSLVTLFLLAGTALYAQSYPKRTVKDIMTIPADSLAAGSLNTPRVGDTVVIRGIVSIPPVVKFPDDNRKIMIAGNRNYAIYLQDEAAAEFAGIPVVCDTSNTASNFVRLKAGQLIEVPVRITAFPNNNKLGTTQAEVISKGVVEFLDDGITPKTPPAVKVADFVTGKVTAPNWNLTSGAKYIGMKVEFSNLTVVSAVKSPTSQRTTIIVADEAGNEMYLRDQSNYFRTDAVQLAPFAAPTDGQKIKKLRGYISTNLVQGAAIPFMISPGIPTDLELDMDAAPPVITSARSTRTNAFPKSTETVPVTVGLRQGAKPVKSAVIMYTVDGGTAQSVNLTKQADTIWTATLPAQSANALVRWYINATDEADIKVRFPGGDTSYIYYRVLDRAAKISDIREQFTPNAATQYDGYSVTITGTVTASAADIPNEAQNAPRVYIQDATDGYSGLFVRTTAPTSVVRAFPRSSRVEVTGIIREVFGVTALDSVSNQNAKLIAATSDPIASKVLSTADFSRRRQGEPIAEQWESMLVEFKNIIIADSNADGASDFGEFTVVDASSFNVPGEAAAKCRVETDDGSTTYSVVTKTGRTVLSRGTALKSLSGIMYFSFGNYKLVPRNNEDISLGATNVEFDYISSVTTMQIMPNPAQDKALLSLQLSAPINGSIKLYSTLGAPVMELHKGLLTAGYHSFEIPSILPAGFYLCRIESGNAMQSVPFIVNQ